MLPTLTLQLDDLSGGFATLNGSETFDQPIGVDLAAPGGEAPTSFAALLPTPEPLPLPTAGGLPLPEGGNSLPVNEVSVPIERTGPDQELLLEEIKNPTSLELRLFSERPSGTDATSREASLAALAVSPLRPKSMDGEPRSVFKRDNYDVMSGRDMAIQHQLTGTDNPLEVKPVIDSGMRVPTLWGEAGEWAALRESGMPASNLSNLAAGLGVGDGDSAMPTALKALQTNLQIAPQSLNGPPTSQIAAPNSAPAQVMTGMTIAVPVQDGAWSDALSQRVTLLAGSQQSMAEIRLTPAELGPIRVSVAMDDGAANVTFTAQHSVTREAIESALPRLRELLTENGLSLGHASVSDQSTEHGQEPERTERETVADVGDVSDDEARAPVQTARAALGLIDTFA
ncbi:MAG: flagellar hook-length control protein FliK [Pseudomonadota bacterium]